MDDRIKQWVDLTREKLGLHHYFLHTNFIHSSINVFNETEYYLHMAWYPKDYKESNEEVINPPGTAVVELNLKTGRFRSIIFIDGKRETPLRFPPEDLSSLIQWIEQETGLIYETQFRFVKQEEQRRIFHSCYKGMPISPFGEIEVSLDDGGYLFFYFNDGIFPSKDEVEEEPYVITFDQSLNKVVEKEMKFHQFPSSKQRRWISVYTLQPVNIRNKDQSILPFPKEQSGVPSVVIDQLVEWDTPEEEPFIPKRESNPRKYEVTMDDVLANTPHRDIQPITNREKEKAVAGVQTFMRKVFPYDSGLWKLYMLHRAHGKLNGVLKRVQDEGVLQRKVSVILEPDNFEAVHYFDNKFLLKMFGQEPSTNGMNVRKEEAVEEILSVVQLNPVYVYDTDIKKFVLCGKLDCTYGVMADSGEVVLLSEL
ncbi:MAG TPA: hypothetical protein DDY49_08140 [Paenibacillaceae bacterium]|nr:hypothetical protein [Paenibacillaceae bacterium]